MIILVLKLVLILLAAAFVVLLIAGLVWGARRAKRAIDYRMLPANEREAIKFEEQIEWHDKVRSKLRNLK